MMNNENIVSVILQDSSDLIVGDSYRFCLVLVEQKNIKRDLVVGCSNITKLELIENANSYADDGTTRETNEIPNLETNQSDITSIDKVSSQNDEFVHRQTQKSIFTSQLVSNKSKSLPGIVNNPPTGQTFEVLKNMNGSFLPGLGVGILVTSIFVLIWGIMKLKGEQQSNQPITTCYMASCDPANNRVINLTDNENRSQYLKLQATTNL